MVLASPLILILVLGLLGLVALVVFSFVYVISSQKKGTLKAGLITLLSIGVVVGVALLIGMPLLSHTSSPVPPGADQAPTVTLVANQSFATIAVAVLIGTLLITKLFLSSKKREANAQPNGGALILFSLVACLLLLGWASLRYMHSFPQQVAELDSELAPISMEQSWDELTKPRILIDNEVIVDVDTVATEQTPTELTEREIDVAVPPQESPAMATPPTAPSTTDSTATDSTATKTTASEPRPKWVDTPPKRIGDNYKRVVVTDEYSTLEECQAARDRLVLSAAEQRIKQLSQDEAEYFRVHAPDALRMGITSDYILRHVATDEYIETVERSFGPMLKVHTLLEFTASNDDDLRRHWAIYEQQRRLSMVASLAAVVLGSIGIVYTLMKVDTWTKGYYTKRLFVGVPAAIIGLLLLATVLMPG